MKQPPNVTVTEFCCNEIHSVIKQRIVIFLFLFLNLELSFLFIHSAFFHTSIYAPKERLKFKSNSENSKFTSFFFCLVCLFLQTFIKVIKIICHLYVETRVERYQDIKNHSRRQFS